MKQVKAKELPVGAHFGWVPPGEVEFDDPNEQNGVVVSNTPAEVVVQFGGWIGRQTFRPEEVIEITWSSCG